jgi:hypothetical protein
MTHSHRFLLKLGQRIFREIKHLYPAENLINCQIGNQLPNPNTPL